MDDQRDAGQDLTEVRDELRDLRRGIDRNADVLRKIQITLPGMGAEIGKLDGSLAALSATVSQALTEVASIGQTVTATQKSFEDFVQRYGKDQIVANANAELSRLTTTWMGQFAPRRNTRSLARGLVHTLTARSVEHGMVDTTTIETCAQERMLVEPTFWLAPAIMALAAEYSQDGARATRARGKAFWLDPAKSKLFFSLTCSRMGWQGQAARWMDRYLNSLDPDDLGQEFIVVLDAIANNELGHEAKTYADQAMGRWYGEKMHSTPAGRGHGSTPAHLSRWQKRLLGLIDTSDRDEFPTLRSLCGSDWPKFEQGWRTATALTAANNYLTAEFPADDPMPVGEGRYADSALDRLINRHEPDESRMHGQMERLNSLIQHKGETEFAELMQSSDSEAESIDFVSLLENSVFAPGLLQMGNSARHLALQCVWPDLRKATETLANTARTLVPESITLTIGDWTCRLSTSPGRSFNSANLARDLAEHVEGKTRSNVDSVVHRWPLIVSSSVLGAATGFFLTPFLHGSAKISFTVLTVLLFFVALLSLTSVPVRRRNLREEGTRQQNFAQATLRSALNEYTHLVAEWRSGLIAGSHLYSWVPPRMREVEK